VGFVAVGSHPRYAKPRPGSPQSVRRQRDSDGQGLAALILAIALLGGLGAAIPLVIGSTSGPRTDQELPSQRASAPQGAASDIQAAATTCEVDYQAAQTAVETYEAINGRPPASMADLQTVLRGPISSTRFSITINRARPGEIDVAAGGRPPQPGSANCAYAR
jgi:hypothetical protein